MKCYRLKKSGKILARPLHDAALFILEILAAFFAADDTHHQAKLIRPYLDPMIKAHIYTE